MERVLSTVRFREAARARENLERLRPRVKEPAARSLAALLAQLPDPDGSLNLLERFSEAAPAAVMEYVSAHPAALHYLLAVFSYSAFLSETLLREPELIVNLHSGNTLFRLQSREEMLEEYRRFAGGGQALARFKRREYLRIMLRDVLQLATLAEVTMELSALADALLEAALERAQAEMTARYGPPGTPFTILSLGKLGGNELNYSSDIDLIFLYRGGDETGSGITPKEYFIQMAHRVIGLITALTPEGKVFRVDFRLRPEGRQGELAVSLPAALKYYRRRARDWELQALVKARHSAGDAALAREFLESVQPLVYRGGPRNFAALDSVLFARERISAELRRRRSRAVDVKLERGGIRDIEFLGQCLQRLYGGQEPWVRSGSTLFALQKLADKGLLSQRDHSRLSQAYHFLRTVEHRLQLDRGQQIHRVPEDPEELDLLARRAGLQGIATGAALLAELDRNMSQVREIYHRVVLRARGPEVAPSMEVGAAFALQAQAATLAADQSFPELLRAMEANFPALYAAVRALTLERGRQNLQRFLMNAYARPAALAALAGAPELLDRAAVIFEESPYLGDLLARNPEDVEVLREMAGPRDGETQIDISVEMPGPAYVVPDDPLLEHVAGLDAGLTEKMTLLRRHYRRRLLRIHARSILEAAPVFQTLEATTRLAEQMIRAAFRVALESIGPQRPGAFTVVALGRLGVREFDVGSDADLSFVSFSPAPEDRLFWIRASERLIEVLSSHTAEGIIFSVDTRLRPRGREGELVESGRYVEGYFQDKAEPWEAITYMKSRAVAGDLEAGTELLTRVQNTIGARFAGPEAAAQLAEMRKRLQATANPHNYLKTAAGGYYDIDFVLTYLRLRAAGLFFTSLNTLERLAVVERSGQLTPEQAAVLREGAVLLRALEHALRVQSGRSDTELPLSGPSAAPLARLAARWLPEPLHGRPLSDTLPEVMERVRRVFLEVFAG